MNEAESDLLILLGREGLVCRGHETHLGGVVAVVGEVLTEL
jgi:hypothetical protein